MKRTRFSISGRLKSLSHAFRGFGVALLSEHNLWIHLIATVFVLFLGLFLEITKMDWIAVLFAIGLVISAELMNTAVEELGDAITQEEHPLVGKAKDVAAAGVLVAALAALAIGLLVFLPYFF